MKLRQVLIPLCLACSTAAGAAALTADAVRVTVGGETRVVRTLGRPTDPEFYAPLTRQLRSLWLDVQPSGAGEVEVRYRGNRAAVWPVVTGEDQLPGEPGHPAALREGGELFVPVRALVALGGGWLDWDAPHRTVTITPTVRRLELLQDERGVEVRVEASAPVRVTGIQLANPSRCVIDIAPAWFHLDGTPRPAGLVRSVRLGQFTRDTARIVMELTDSPARISGLPQSGTAITARLQPGEPSPLARANEPAAAGESSATGEPASSSLAAIAPSAAPPASPMAVADTRRAPTVKRHRRRAAKRSLLASRGGYIHRTLSPFTAGIGGALAGRVICVDPGHGGPDTGALGLNGLTERDSCLAMANQLARALREAGATVLMTRDSDRYVSLEDRYTFANLQAADIYISIHCNAMAHHNTMSGTETYYWTPQSFDLARAVHPEVVRVMGGRDGGIRQRQFAVIHHTTMPSILLEVGYIDNTGDAAKLGDPAFQEALGNAVRDGLMGYFSPSAGAPAPIHDERRK